MSEARSALLLLLARGRAAALIVFACTAVFLWQTESGYPDGAPPFYRTAFAVWRGDFRGFFLSILGHAGFLHFAMNAVVILLYGAILEIRLGAVRLVVTFLVSGVMGNAFGILWSPAISSIGASGGAMGLVGGLFAFGIRSGRSPWDFFGTAIARPLLVVVAIMLALGFVPGNILDNAAHLGGLVGGFVYVFVFGMPGVTARAGVVGRIAAAVLFFEATVYALNPVLDARYWATRVIAFGTSDEFQAAREGLERFERLEPDAGARQAIVLSLLEPGPMVEGPEMAGFAYAEVLHHSGRREEAGPFVDRIVARHREVLGKAMLHPEERATLQNNLAWTLLVFGRDPSEAWALASEATRVARHPAFVGTLGVAALRRGNFETARVLLEESVRKYDPRLESSRANDLYYLSIALSRLGRRDEARRRFEEAHALAPEAAIADEALEALGPRGA